MNGTSTCHVWVSPQGCPEVQIHTRFTHCIVWLCLFLPATAFFVFSAIRRWMLTKERRFSTFSILSVKLIFFLLFFNLYHILVLAKVQSNLWLVTLFGYGAFGIIVSSLSVLCAAFLQLSNVLEDVSTAAKVKAAETNSWPLPLTITTTVYFIVAMTASVLIGLGGKFYDVCYPMVPGTNTIYLMCIAAVLFLGGLKIKKRLEASRVVQGLDKLNNEAEHVNTIVNRVWMFIMGGVLIPAAGFTAWHSVESEYIDSQTWAIEFAWDGYSFFCLVYVMFFGIQFWAEASRKVKARQYGSTRGTQSSKISSV